VTVRRLGERINIRACRHRLRHTLALMFLKNGGDPYTLQYLLGHEDMTTVREYVKIAAHDTEEAAESLCAHSVVSYHRSGVANPAKVATWRAFKVPWRHLDISISPAKDWPTGSVLCFLQALVRYGMIAPGKES
jgi:hypothetical protein